MVLPAHPGRVLDEGGGAEAGRVLGKRPSAHAGGKAPIGDDGFPVELHHKVPLSRGGTNDFSNLEPLTRTGHRLGGNFRRNHP